MALIDAVPEIMSPVLEQALLQQNVWPALCTDLSSQLAGGGDRLIIPSDATVYTVNSRTAALTFSATIADHARGTPTIAGATVVNLDPDAYYNVDVVVPTWVQYSIPAPLLAEVSSRLANAFIEQANNNLRAKLLAIATTAQIDTITVKTAEWGNTAHLTALAKTFRGNALNLDGVKVPREGRVTTVSPEVQDLIQEKIITDKFFLPSGITDSILVNRELPRYRGFDVIMDDSVGVGHSATDDNRHLMSHFRRNMGIVYAQRLIGVRGFESETYRGIRVVGDLVVFTLVSRPSLVFVTKHVITT